MIRIKMLQSTLSRIGAVLALSMLGLTFFDSRLGAQSMTDSGSDGESVNVSFDAVQPILRKHCVRCHNEDQPRGDLVLSSLDKVLAGSSSGFVVVAGKVQESPLYTLTAHLDNPKMPPNKPRISQRELNTIEKWIMTGLAEESRVSGKNTSETSLSSQPSASVGEIPITQANPSISSRVNADASKVFGLLAAIPQPTPVRAMAAHPSQPIVVVSSLHQVAILNTNTVHFEEQAIALGNRDVSALRFSPDGKLLLIAAGMIGESGTLLVMDWQTKKWLPSVGDEPDNIQSLDCNSDASQVTIGTTTRLVKTFDRSTQKELFVQRKHTDWVLSVSYSGDGFLVASGDRFGGIHVWETDTGKEFAALRGHTGGISGLAWTKDNNQLISSSLDGTVRVWNMHSLQTEKQWIAHQQGVLSLAMGANDELLTSGRDGWIRKWTAGSTTPSWQSKLPDEAIAVCCPNGEPDAVIGADAVGGLYRMLTSFSSTDDPKARTLISFPHVETKRQYAAIAPSAPMRSLLKPISEINTGETAVSAGMPVPQRFPVQDEAAENSFSDLEESRRALASVEKSLEQTYRTAEQLEESVARLKQLIVLQEARLKQMEIKQKSKR